jgi:RimJ/RimL family protein N-acetyltransferase
VLTTDRLVLRRWRDDDREPFAALNADPGVMRFFPAPLTRAESDAFADRAEESFETRGYGLWVVEREEKFLGFTGLKLAEFASEFTPAVEVAWRFAAHAWGNGYATEAARAAVADGFDRLGLAEIVSFTAVVNRPSWAVMERLGMRRSGEFDHPAVPVGHELRRHVLYRLDRHN